MPPYRPLLDRFVEKFELDLETGCWNWTACLSKKGYGKFQVAAHKCVEAHKVSFEIFHGPVPDGFEVDHKCRNRKCVNPNHLRPLRHIDNSDNNRRKTHCPKGHEYTPDNTYNFDLPSGNKARICVQCRRERIAKKKGVPIEQYGTPKTHCKQGHEFTPDNTRLRKRGGRDCHLCMLDRSRKHKAKVKALNNVTTSWHT